MVKRSFLFHYDWVNLLMDCGEEVRYEVYDAIMRYAQSGTLSELKPLAGMAFRIIKQEMDDDARKYNETVEKRRHAGRQHKGNQYTNGTNGTSVPNVPKPTEKAHSEKSHQKIENGTNGTSVPIDNQQIDSGLCDAQKSGMEHNGTNGTDMYNDCDIYIKKNTTNVVLKEISSTAVAVSPPPSKDEILIRRSKKFSETILPYVQTYGPEMCKDFFDYWTEPNKSHTKMRFEMEKTWDIGRRLSKWSENDYKFHKRPVSVPSESSKESYQNAVMQAIAINLNKQK